MTLKESISQYEYVRVLVLGNEVGVGIAQPRSGAGADGFDAFVSSAYVAVRETLAEDASFLASVGAMGTHEATRSLHLLRTARQHDDNQGAVNFYNNWVGNEPVDWDDAAERLVDQVDDYLRTLTRAAQAVRQSSSLAQQWKDADSVSVPTVFASVCRDLSLSFPFAARQAKVRAIESRYRRERPAGAKRQIIADLCVQEALAESGVLPVDYSELLDELGLLGSREAPAVLALAYATARALPGTFGDDFKRKTSEMWWSLVRT